MMMMGGNMSGGGSMGMDSMMNMMNDQMSNMGANMNGMGSMTMNGPMGSVQVSGNAGMMGNGYMQGMANPNAMNNMMANHNAAFGANGNGFGLDNIFSGIFNLAFDLLAILLVVGLIVGIVVFIKKYVTNGQFGSFVNTNKVVCTKCGHTINSQWGFCPNCGTSKVVPQEAGKEIATPTQA